MVDNIMDAMMDMRLRLPVGVVEHLTGGVDDAIQKLTSNVLYHVGSADVLVPPVPPLTRWATARPRAMTKLVAYDAAQCSWRRLDNCWPVCTSRSGPPSATQRAELGSLVPTPVARQSVL